ncbi:MAG: HYR domain-containing protein [Saprospiraceae bacterium]
MISPAWPLLPITVRPAASESQSPAPNDILTVGNHTVTIIATDDVALAGDCTFTLEVTPSCQPPTVSCQIPKLFLPVQAVIRV